MVTLVCLPPSQQSRVCCVCFHDVEKKVFLEKVVIVRVTNSQLGQGSIG